MGSSRTGKPVHCRHGMPASNVHGALRFLLLAGQAAAIRFDIVRQLGRETAQRCRRFMEKSVWRFQGRRLFVWARSQLWCDPGHRPGRNIPAIMDPRGNLRLLQPEIQPLACKELRRSKEPKPWHISSPTSAETPGRSAPAATTGSSFWTTGRAWPFSWAPETPDGVRFNA